MTVSREDVLHVAGLAEIRVDEPDLPGLVSQMNRIVGYVAQLGEVPATSADAAFLPGPAGLRLRDDVVEPAELTRTPEAIAPAFRDGFFVVPKVGGMDP